MTSQTTVESLVSDLVNTAIAIMGECRESVLSDIVERGRSNKAIPAVYLRDLRSILDDALYIADRDKGGANA